MSTLLKNMSGSAMMVDDLGLPVKVGETIDLIAYGYSLDDLAGSTDLDNLITTGAVIINDGIADLSISDALKHTNYQDELVDSQEEKTLLSQNGLPPGGEPTQKLIKKSEADYDAEWVNDPDAVVPPPPNIVIQCNDKFAEKHWETGTTFTFDGTDELGAVPTSVVFLIQLDCDNGTVRLRDKTHNKVIAMLTKLSGNDEDTISELGTTLTHIPTGSATIVLQGKVHNKEHKLTVKEFTIKFG